MKTRDKTMTTLKSFPILIALAALSACSTMNSGHSAAPAAGQQTFATPEEAVRAVGAMAGGGDEKRTEEIFGPGSNDLVRSGDEVADHDRALEVKAMIDRKVAFEDLDTNMKVALLGDDAWPFPIPLVKGRSGWYFDTEAGREEVENRRVGRNELETLATLHAVVDAQREYGASHGGAYAQRVISSKGKHDGLYWPVAAGKPSSPLGPLVAEAAAEGYKAGNEPQPYHGYYFKMLTAQGANAPEGAKSYLDAKGAMTKGFAMVAWPANYGNSGKMTFLVSDRGIVFQKDLGENTESVASAITTYDPDDSWDPTGD